MSTLPPSGLPRTVSKVTLSDAMLVQVGGLGQDAGIDISGAISTVSLDLQANP